MKKEDFLALPCLIGESECTVQECLDDTNLGSIEIVLFKKDLIWHWHRSFPNTEYTNIYFNFNDSSAMATILMSIDEFEAILFTEEKKEINNEQ